MLPLMVFLGTLAGAWYLLIVRPQKDSQTRHGRLIDQLQVGDHVLTVGGIYGRVVALEGSSVVLELAPGLTSRITTDGLARIVHGSEAALPMNETPREALDEHMHQHPDPQQAHPQPQPMQPQVPLDQQPQYAYPQHGQPQVVHAQHALPPSPLPAPPAPGMHEQQPGTTTFRAHVLPQVPTFEPRPWGTSVSPVNHVAQHQQQPVQYAAPPLQPQPQQHVQPMHYAMAPAPQPVQSMPQPSYPAPPHMVQPAPQHHVPNLPPAPVLVQPFAPQPQQSGPQPIQYMMPPVVPATSVQQHSAQHQHQHQHQAYAQPAPTQMQHQHPQHAPVAQEDAGRRSRAPQGMGSSLRLDDPSLRDTLDRARSERAGLAEEYRKISAPLVDASNPGPVQHQHAQPTQQLAAAPIGHDPRGVPLFATQPGSPHAPAAMQYPSPAHVPVEGGMPVPRPHIQHGDQQLDAAQTAAFQRRTPYSPQDPAAHGQPAPAHAHAHA